jgi:hypothetical protein
MTICHVGFETDVTLVYPFTLNMYIFQIYEGGYTICIHIMNIGKYEVYRSVPGLGQKKKCWLNLLKFSAMYFKIVFLRTYTETPSFISSFKSTVKAIFLNAVEYRLRFPLDFRHCFKTSSIQFHFQFRKQSEITEG